MTTIKSSELKKIDTNFSGTFKNLSYKNIRKHGNGYEFDNLGVLRLFEIGNQNVDSINVSFTTDNSLILKYSDSTGTRTGEFSGKFSKRGFYEFYFNKHNIEIPPFIPIIYSNTKINRIRISLSSENKLLIEKYRAQGGNVFILGGGGSSKSIYYFEPINK